MYENKLIYDLLECEVWNFFIKHTERSVIYELFIYIYIYIYSVEYMNIISKCEVWNLYYRERTAINTILF